MATKSMLSKIAVIYNATSFCSSRTHNLQDKIMSKFKILQFFFLILQLEIKYDFKFCLFLYSVPQKESPNSLDEKVWLFF